MAGGAWEEGEAKWIKEPTASVVRLDPMFVCSTGRGENKGCPCFPKATNFSGDWMLAIDEWSPRRSKAGIQPWW